MATTTEYLITRHPEQGWSITRLGREVGTSSNIVDAIDLANRLAERDHGTHQGKATVLIFDRNFPERSR